jgi:hypothetical protein
MDEECKMKRPKQLPAVDRNNVTKSAAVPVGAGGNVRASFDWGSLVPIATGLLGAL